ncbi:hypothetical protein QBC46DRAFT_398210 [Diplogelasinospora grovesii]|uniref:Uncharacterized protein n=1 Tax=Diplogelasinospora grovesii TaxID=303347 RepID=A0AAN6MZ15_9PEZI|nr:hypothetical protein QBC46DRAFT_398210 [Diplogelasinospora grovesii]
MLSFAIGPFTQQAIKTGACPQILGNVNSSLPIANFIPGSSSYRFAAGLWEIEVDMKGTMIQGLTNPKGNDSAILPSCPSGNCTDYGTGVTHASIGLCSKCIDTTSKVKGPDKGGNITLPDNDVYISIMSDAPFLTSGSTNLSWAVDLFPDNGFAEAAHVALTNISILAASTAPCTNDTSTNFTVVCPHNTSITNYDYGGTTDYVATSCALYPCLRTYHGSVDNGILTEKLISTAPAPVWEAPDYPSSWYAYNFTAVREPCILDASGTWYTRQNMSSAPNITGRTWHTVPNLFTKGQNATVPNACLYKMYGVYAMALYRFMADTLFDASCTYNSRQGGELYCGNAWWLSPLYSQKNATFESLSTALDDFATAVTNKFRTTASGPDALEIDDPNVFRTADPNLTANMVQGIVGAGYYYRLVW